MPSGGINIWHICQDLNSSEPWMPLIRQDWNDAVSDKRTVNTALMTVSQDSSSCVSKLAHLPYLFFFFHHTFWKARENYPDADSRAICLNQPSFSLCLLYKCSLLPSLTFLQDISWAPWACLVCRDGCFANSASVHLLLSDTRLWQQQSHLHKTMFHPWNFTVISGCVSTLSTPKDILYSIPLSKNEKEGDTGKCHTASTTKRDSETNVTLRKPR